MVEWGVKGLWEKNHLKHDYPLQLSERETHWVSSVRGDTSCNILFAKENHEVHVKCYYLKLEYLSATKRCLYSETLGLISGTSWTHSD